MKTQTTVYKPGSRYMHLWEVRERIIELLGNLINPSTLQVEVRDSCLNVHVALSGLYDSAQFQQHQSSIIHIIEREFENRFIYGDTNDQ